MYAFFRRYWGRLLTLVVMAVLLFILWLVPHTQRQILADMTFKKVQVIYRPVGTFISKAQSWLLYQGEYILRQYTLNDQVVDLQKENAILRRQKIESKDRDHELDRLRKLLEMKQRVPIKTEASEVIGLSPSSYYLTLIIDKGSEDGMRKGMVVLGQDGILGRIISVSPRTSKILLITDQRSAVSVTVQRTGARSILEGMGTTRCKLTMETPDAQIKTGDRIYTNGMGGVFPPNLYVGYVSYIKRDKRSGWALSVQVKPAVDCHLVREVLIVTQPQNRESWPDPEPDVEEATE